MAFLNGLLYNKTWNLSLIQILGDLNVFEDGTVVTPALLMEKGIKMCIRDSYYRSGYKKLIRRLKHGTKS